jgi:branched-chain amino acid transport system substrate-binding protein
MTKEKTTTGVPSDQRRRIIKASAAAGIGAALGFPAIVRAQGNQPIKIGMPTVLSGRVAQLGISSRNAAQLEVEKFNAAGGFNGRMIELIVRDSKGRPEEAAKLTRDMINSEKCHFILDAEASSGAFAVHEVVRELGTLCLHTNSETSSLTADPKLQIPNAFRVARQGAQDAIVAGQYAGKVAKEKNLTKWMTIGPDYAYGRDSTEQFLRYLKQYSPSAKLIGEAWPKLFQPDYTESITKILQVKPQAIYTALWGGDLVSFIDQGNLYGLFKEIEIFSIALGDYTTVSQIKNLPKNIHSGTRYLSAFPNTKENAAWSEAYQRKFKDVPTNWAWQTAAAINFFTEAMRKTNSADGKKMAAVLPGMTIKSPFGTNGQLTIRKGDNTLVDYAIGWGKITTKPPYLSGTQTADWATIIKHENEWKKEMGWA